MMNKLISILLFSLFAGGLFAFDTGKGKPPSQPSARDDYEAFKDIRAAKILQRVKYRGTGSYTFKNGKTEYFSPASKIEFNNESNHIWLTFNGEYRQGKIINPGKSGLNATRGVYIINTWIPQNYVGFNKGPSRKYFKKFKLIWKVETVSSAKFKGRMLHLTVQEIRFSGSKRSKRLKFIFKEVKRGY